VPGHWEGDLICGSHNSFIATLVERHTRYVMLAKVSGKDTEAVISALIKQAKKLPNELYKSLTWDRGSEMADHQRFTLDTDIQVYFCDPSSPWQRGSNENTNRLLRQYFPKGTNLSVHSQAKLNGVARQLNERPRNTCAKSLSRRFSVRYRETWRLNKQKKRYMAPPRAAMKPGAASWPVCYQFSPERPGVVAPISCRWRPAGSTFSVTVLLECRRMRCTAYD
jgi:hypothetical protein